MPPIAKSDAKAVGTIAPRPAARRRRAKAMKNAESPSCTVPSARKIRVRSTSAGSAAGAPPPVTPEPCCPGTLLGSCSCVLRPLRAVVSAGGASSGADCAPRRATADAETPFTGASAADPNENAPRSPPRIHRFNALSLGGRWVKSNGILPVAITSSHCSRFT